MMRASLLLSLAGALVAGTAQAEIALYPTGPSEDSAFLRFVNATPGALQLVAAGSSASLELKTTNSVSDYLSVPAGKAIKGTLKQAAGNAPLDLSVAPGEFATVVALPGRQVVVREQPDDFNGLKASLAFINVDPACSGASLRPAGRNADLFKDAPEGSVQRRSINPVKLSVQLVCANANVGAPVDLGELKAGERYSVMLLPGEKGPQLLATTDTLAH
ncbi:alginate O-acetyltransferase AlgF [Pseudomonas sp. NY15354]|uniref:alginate O-acetyltransferase AlgF n=1 Tax=Pseudomonas sp. NY15354 TaxID=3400351 RepID=UPI003A86A304